MQRLAERHDALGREYGGIPLSLEQRHDLLAAADAVTLQHDRTRWIDLDSYSRRQHKRTPIGGFVGTAVYAGDVAPLLPLLMWGSVIQAGKDTTKGNGMYEVGNRKEEIGNRK